MSIRWLLWSLFSPSQVLLGAVVPGGVLLDAALHEWLGLLYYRLTGRTHELFPAP